MAITDAYVTTLCPGGATVPFVDYATSSNTCGAGGSPFTSGSAMVAAGGGVLLLQADGSAAQAMCFWPGFAAHAGVVAEIASASTTGGDVFFGLFWNGSGASNTNLVLSGSAPTVTLGDQSNLGIGSAMLGSGRVWLRLVLVGGSALEGEYSTDGASWTTLGTSTWTSGSPLGSPVSLSVAALTSGSGSAWASVAAIYLCN